MGKIGFIFSGQGAQYIGMGKDIVVITSYSIHYTKLYEKVMESFHFKSLIFKIVFFLMKNVITSYSIHYTKLYDGYRA